MASRSPQPDHLPQVPPSLLQEYLTFGGGAYGQSTYSGEDYIQDTSPRSYFEEMGRT